MKRRVRSFSGSRPVFTGAVSIVPGGYNLDKTNQSFAADAVIPEGSLAIVDETNRTVQIIKTAKVVAIDADDAKKVSLKVSEFYEPLFVAGEPVYKAGFSANSVAWSNVPTISNVKRTDNSFDIVLSAAITGLAVGDVLEIVQKVTVGSNEQAADYAAEIGAATRLTVSDVEVRDFETPIDVTADTLQYALYKNRVAPIPASQISGEYLAGNCHIRLTEAQC